MIGLPFSKTFDDERERKDLSLARVLHGSMEEHLATLIELNRRGAGVFVTINETDLRGRKRENIVRVRAVWQEDDGAGTVLPLEPHLVIESSPGKHHRYLFVGGLELEEHRAVQEVLVERYGSDPSAKDISWVLRLPGFYHRKGEPHLVQIVAESDAQAYSRVDILRAFQPVLSAPPPLDAGCDGLILEGNRNGYLTSLAGTMRRRGMSEEGIAAALQAESIRRCAPPLDATEVQGIARSVARYEPEDDPSARYATVERAVRAVPTAMPARRLPPRCSSVWPTLKKDDRAAFESLRNQLKDAGCRVAALDEAVAEASGVPGRRNPDPSRRPDRAGD